MNTAPYEGELGPWDPGPGLRAAALFPQSTADVWHAYGRPAPAAFAVDSAALLAGNFTLVAATQPRDGGAAALAMQIGGDPRTPGTPGLRIGTWRPDPRCIHR